MIMTVEKLLKTHACDEQVESFRRLFPPSRYPRGVRITVALCEQHADVFDWRYAVQHFVPGDMWANLAAFSRLTRKERTRHSAAVVRFSYHQSATNDEKLRLTSVELFHAEARAFALLIRDPKARK